MTSRVGMAVAPAAACQACGGAVAPGARFCRACGAPLPATPVAAAEAPAQTASLSAPAEAPGPPRPLWLTVAGVMFMPGQLLERAVGQTSWTAALPISGMAFALFFLQTGLDLARAGKGTLPGAAALAATGAVYGSLGVAVVALIAWVMARPFGCKHPASWAVRAFAIGYSPALIYASMGVLFNLFLGWNTAVAFGVTGVLWAFGPLVSAIRTMTEGKMGVSVAIATACGGALLYGWAFIGAGR